MVGIPGWIILVLAVVVLWGVGENFTKKSTELLGARTLLLFYALAALVVWGLYWYLMGHPSISWTSTSTVVGFIASIFYAIGMIPYYRALDVKESKISLVSPITGLHPVATIVLANAFLGEGLGYFSGSGVVLVVFGTLLLSLRELRKRLKATLSAILLWIGELRKRPKATLLATLLWIGELRKRPEANMYSLSLLAMLLWSVGDVLAKYSITEQDHVRFLLIYLLSVFTIWSLYWLVGYVRSRRKRPKFVTQGPHLGLYASDRPDRGRLSHNGVIPGLISVVLFTIGSIFLYRAFESGQVSLVSPIAAAYPICTVVIANRFFQERLSLYHVAAVAAFVAGTVLVTLER